MPRLISTAEFRLIQRLVYDEAGIHLSDTKQALVVARLARRLRELGLGSFRAYHERIVAGDGEERDRFLDAITTNETSFFREPQQFAFLEERVLPEWIEAAAAGARRRLVRAWSAACSTGEEPYSLAMTLRAGLPPEEGWRLEILGTDLSKRVLARAHEGTYPLGRAECIPKAYLRRFMLRGTESKHGLVRVSPELRRLVRFERSNLSFSSYTVGGPFDLIFCRNALIYFKPEDRPRVVERLVGHLAPGGYLFLGHAESLTAFPGRMRRVGPMAYAVDVTTDRRGPA